MILQFNILLMMATLFPSISNKLYQQPIKRPLIKGISSVAFYSNNLKENIEFYHGYLGFETSISSPTNKDQLMIEVNNKQTIKLIANTRNIGNRLAYFSIETNDAEMMRRYLLSKGVQAPTNKLKETNGVLGFFIKDPNGTICQFIQKTKHFPVSKNGTESNNNRPIAMKMNHVGFMVADLEKANQFYVDILGFMETWRGSKDGNNVTWVNLRVTDGTDYIELMLYDKEQSTENMGVLNHLSLEVENIFEIEKRLFTRVLPQNFKKTTPIKVGINKKRQINTFDSDGTRIEIMEANTIDGIPAKSSSAAPLRFKGRKN